ncbi:PP2C family protein-serine/threonine phosphatase [Streptomyces tsukubensis]|uniref:Stage II sporulation protein E n=1 Tax=Streptomyces tsukubensis TaxID=83656 RepID=A0A1V4A4X2_9ACTN|nr:PP2C family protein-serine/threonine phosphatase [Streptomyces tsukubensis]OON74968.1 stage II sporulation protein E [Streptomyces tsukubensis]QFR97855.1 SpoIIE family protein phosphatase [Streptomyces tsukubensis]
MLADLLTASHLMPLELLPAKVAEHAAAVGFSQVLVYLADLQRDVLRLLTGEGQDAGRGGGGEESELTVEGSVAGRAYQYGQILAGAPVGPDGRQWWVPLLDGTERLGALRITTTDDDPRTREDMNVLAALVALIVESKQGSSDSHARLTRTRPLNIAAEMQWHLMPPRTYADGRVVISAAMEPAHTISGDAYDYATAGHVVHLSIFDAMGHDTAAGLTAHLSMGACRNSRRQGAGLVEITERIEEVLIEQFGLTRYATGLLAELDTRTGALTWVNRGHHPPVIIRGGRWSSHLRGRPAHPMGTALGLPTTLFHAQLEPGDRIVFYTDGITEARGADGQEFGLRRFTDFLIRRHADGLPVPETLRRLVHAVLEYHDGQLQDDATVLICEWLGPAADPSDLAAALVGLPPRPHPETGTKTETA